jgi:hypothetical protein
MVKRMISTASDYASVGVVGNPERRRESLHDAAYRLQTGATTDHGVGE